MNTIQPAAWRVPDGFGDYMLSHEPLGNGYEPLYTASAICAMNAHDAVVFEVTRATEKYPTWPTDPLHALAVLGEEFGELTKAMLQQTYEPHKTSMQNIREEAIQTAAMAIRLVMSLDRYEYATSPQHEQTRGLPL